MAGRTRRAMINVAIQVVSQLFTWTLTWVLLIYLPRYLGDEGFGRLFFAISYAALFGVFMSLGINTYLVKEVARCREDTPLLVGNVLLMKLLLSTVIYLASVGLIFLLPYDGEQRLAVIIIGLAGALGTVTLTLGSVYQGFERMFVPNLALVLEKVVVTGLAVFLLFRGWGLIPVCWVYLAAALVNLAVCSAALGRICRPRFRIDMATWRQIVTGSLPFLIWVVFSEIYIRIDVLMLSLMSGDRVVGWYGAAFRLYATLLFIPHIFNTAVFPALAGIGGGEDSAEDEERRYVRATRRLMNYMMLFSVPIAAGTVMVAQSILLLLYGEGPFENSTIPLQIFGVSIFFICLDVMLGTILITREKQRQWSYAAIAAALLNPAMNLGFIPLGDRWFGNGGVGAAVATLLTEIFMMFMAFHLLPRGILDRRNLVVFGRALLAAAPMVAVLYWCSGLQIWFSIPLGGAVYVIGALVLRVLPADDLAHLKHALLNRGRQA